MLAKWQNLLWTTKEELFWAAISCVSAIGWSHFPSLGCTPPSAPINTSTTVSFSSHSFPSFSCSLFLMSLRIATLLIVILGMKLPLELILFVLSHLWICLPFWSCAFQSMFSTDVFVHIASHFVMTPHVCSVSNLHPADGCWTVSGASLHSLHLGSCWLW